MILKRKKSLIKWLKNAKYNKFGRCFSLASLKLSKSILKDAFSHIIILMSELREKQPTWAFPKIFERFIFAVDALEGLLMFSTRLLSCSSTVPVSRRTADCVGVVAVMIIPCDEKNNKSQLAKTNRWDVLWQQSVLINLKNVFLGRMNYIVVDSYRNLSFVWEKQIGLR